MLTLTRIRKNLDILNCYRKIITFTGLVLTLTNCGPSTQRQSELDAGNTLADPGAMLVVEWNEKALDAIRAEKTPPPAAVRALAMMHGAMYDANVAISGRGRPYLYRTKKRIRGNAGVAVSAAASAVLKNLYPNQNFNATALHPLTIGTNSAQQLGLEVAAAYLQERSSDLEKAKTAPGPSPEVEPGIWRPTLPANAPYLLPGCGTLKPWVVKNVLDIRPVAPYALDSAAYAADFNETKLLGGKNSTARTADQTIIAKFWADGAGTATPPGHWNMITQGLIQDQRMNFQDSLKLFAVLNMAMADAAITAWDAKWNFHVWRPITAIREADTDQNEATTADTTWEPLLATPPFPSYVSGHSTFSGAAAAVLDRYFKGRTIAFKTTSDAMPGEVRSFANFKDAAQEAGRSRIYGGIHFEMDNRAGLQMGEKIATKAFERLGF